MTAHLFKFLSPPVFEDREKTRSTEAIHWFLLAGSGTTLLWMSLLLFQPEVHAGDWLINGTIFSTGLGALWLLRRGHLRLVGIGMSSIVWLAITISVCLNGPLRSSTAIAYLIVIVIVGFIWSLRGALIAALLSLLATLGMSWAARHRACCQPRHREAFCGGGSALPRPSHSPRCTSISLCGASVWHSRRRRPARRVTPNSWKALRSESS